jgi:hypothetical protein
MTIREYMERREALGRLALVLWVLVVLVVGLVFYPGVIGLFGTWALVVGILPMVALLVLLERSTKCPRCKGKLAGGKFDRCSHCGVSLDEPMKR